MKLKDMFELTIGASLLNPMIGAINNSGMGSGLRDATQNMISIGFISHAAGKVKSIFK